MISSKLVAMQTSPSSVARQGLLWSHVRQAPPGLSLIAAIRLRGGAVATSDIDDVLKSGQDIDGVSPEEIARAVLSFYLPDKDSMDKRWKIKESHIAEMASALQKDFESLITASNGLFNRQECLTLFMEYAVLSLLNEKHPQVMKNIHDLVRELSLIMKKYWATRYRECRLSLHDLMRIQLNPEGKGKITSQVRGIVDIIIKKLVTPHLSEVPRAE